MIPQNCAEEYETWEGWHVGTWGYVMDSFMFQDGRGYGLRFS